jgi:tyrosine-protein phosphatase SIW14
MKFLKRVVITSVALASAFAGWQYTTAPAGAHMAPIDDGPSVDYRRHHRWRDDWNSRWQNNWGNSWSNYDNDTVVNRRRYVYNNNTQVDNSSNQETWSSLPKPNDDIPNFHEVHPWLFRGGQPNQDGMHRLYDMGVRTVIDLRSDPNQIASEQQVCQAHGMRFISIPMSASRSPSQQAISKFLSIVDGASKKGDNGAVFVHCHHGSDRTGAMIAIYRMQHDHYSYDQANSEMMKYGFNPDHAKLAWAVKREANAAN